jgi:hypothetical protein
LNFLASAVLPPPIAVLSSIFRTAAGSGHCFFLAILRSILLHYCQAPAIISSSSLLHASHSDNLFDQIMVKSESVIKVNHEIEKM